MVPEESPPIPLRVQGPVYAAALFHGNLYHMASVILPLWAVVLGVSPLWIGIFLGSRQLLSIPFSIHGGALMDRFGARRVILIFSVIGAATMFGFPAMPWIGAAIALQVFSGFGEAVCWIGAQTLVGQIMRGDAKYTGRMIFVARLGGFAGPPLIGLCWDFLGPTGAFSALGIWAICGWVVVWMIPETAVSANRPGASQRLTLRDTLPRLSDYTEAFRLLAIPAVALVIATSMVRQSGAGVQTSFYIVYLEQIGVSGAGIGTLLGISAAFSAIASLAVAPTLRFVKSHWLLMFMVAASIVTIAVTPMMESYIILALVIGARGFSQGYNLPLLLTIASTAVGPESQGKVVALRITVNRVLSALVPIVMGAMAEFIGLEKSFYVIGGVGFVLICALSVGVGRSPAIRARS